MSGIVELLDVDEAIIALPPPPPPPPPAVLIHRPDSAEELRQAMARVHNVDRERRWIDYTVYMGWVVAAALIPAVIVLANGNANVRPPEDRIFVSFERADGTVVNPARQVPDLDASQREATIRKFMFDYVSFRVNYDWPHFINNTTWVKFATAGRAQAEFIRQMNDEPDRPTLRLGKEGEQMVTDQIANRVGENAFEVIYKMKIKSKEGHWDDEISRRVRIAYAFSDDMPAEIASRQDPLKVVVTLWEDHPLVYNPTAPGGAK